MSDLETMCFCLQNLESAYKLLELGVISFEDCEAVVHFSKTWHDATIAPSTKRVKESQSYYPMHAFTWSFVVPDDVVLQGHSKRGVQFHY